MRVRLCSSFLLDPSVNWRRILERLYITVCEPWAIECGTSSKSLNRERRQRDTFETQHKICMFYNKFIYILVEQANTGVDFLFIFSTRMYIFITPTFYLLSRFRLRDVYSFDASSNPRPLEYVPTTTRICFSCVVVVITFSQISAWSPKRCGSKCTVTCRHKLGNPFALLLGAYIYMCPFWGPQIRCVLQNPPYQNHSQ